MPKKQIANWRLIKGERGKRDGGGVGMPDININQQERIDKKGGGVWDGWLGWKWEERAMGGGSGLGERWDGGFGFGLGNGERERDGWMGGEGRGGEGMYVCM